ncbi:hypothetical protein KKD60_05645, partial [Patescibacteria group bacterium]|nr:hypothetical protein [Patescibacteria group bacterium]
MSKDFLVANEASFIKKVEAIRAGGFENLHVLTDFDKTLTRAVVDGVETPSLISVLRREGYLTPDYPARAQALFDKYYPIEINHDISREEKAVAMDEWWHAHFDLLIECGLTKDDVEKATRSHSVRLRAGVKEFMEKMHMENVPIVIISA